MRNDRKKLPPMLISFSGIDGAGKSTQIATLGGYLQSAGLRVEVLRFWDDIARMRRFREDAGHKLFKGDKGIGTPERPISRKDKNIRSPIMTLFRMAIYFVDAVSLRYRVYQELRSQVDVVLFDRYIYDELANLDTRETTTRLYLRGIARIAPRPDIAFILDADPLQARLRKPEYPLEFLRSNRNVFLNLNKMLDCLTVIPPLALAEADVEVRRCVMRELAARNSHIASAGVACGPKKEDWSGARPEGQMVSLQARLEGPPATTQSSAAGEPLPLKRSTNR
jgi:thymidylate kinase